MKKEIGTRLRLVRELKKLNQAELGNSLGIQYQHVSKYERGESVPTWENLIKLIETYNVNINWLLTGRGKMFLSPMGYDAIEDKSIFTIKDIEDIQIEEIVAELKKDKELKTAIYNYVKNYWGVKEAAAKLKRQADGLIDDLK